MDFEDALKHVNRIVINKIAVPVISADDLIKMKEASGRRQDKADVRYLRKLSDEKD